MSNQILSLQLPEQFARMTTRGILFKEHYYSCVLLLSDNWYIQDFVKGEWDIKIYHDPSCENFILVPHKSFGLVVANRLDDFVQKDNIAVIQEYHARLQLLKTKLRRIQTKSLM